MNSPAALARVARFKKERRVKLGPKLLRLCGVMLCGESKDLHKQHFTAFTKHPIWLKLKDDPQYADTVSKITSRFLEPTDYSQV